ncbi:MAG: glutathione S-transferase [Sphingomonas sp.]
MKLWYAPTSPFARKVRIAAAELGLADRISLVETDPWTDARLRAINPLSKVPTLELDDGTVLFESAIICDYLDAQQAEPRLFPAKGPARWQTLLLQGLADGAMTAVGRLFAEERKPVAERSARMLARFRSARDAALDTLEREHLRDDPLIGEIAVAALLGYLDFRWSDRDWRSDRPGLADWFGRFEMRASVMDTRHRLPETLRRSD